MKNIKLSLIILLSIFQTYLVFYISNLPVIRNENQAGFFEAFIQYITLGFIPYGIATLLVAFPADQFKLSQADFLQMRNTPLFYCLCFMINIIFYFFLFKIFGKVFRYFKSGIFGDK